MSLVEVTDQGVRISSWPGLWKRRAASRKTGWDQIQEEIAKACGLDEHAAPIDGASTFKLTLVVPVL